MYRSMNLKGFLVILGVMLLIFLVVHAVLRGAVDNKAEEEKLLRIHKSQLEEENKNLSNRLELVGTEQYIMSSAVRDYAYVKKDAIRFEITNPEVLYAYSEEELKILMDEMND